MPIQWSLDRNSRAIDVAIMCFLKFGLLTEGEEELIRLMGGPLDSLCPPRRWSGAGVGVGMLRGIPLLSAN